MRTRILLAAALFTLAIVLNAYAPARGAETGNRDRKEGGAARDQQPNFANARVTANVTLYYAPNQAIGMLRAGARVRVDRLAGAWAHVMFLNNQIAVQGWIDRRALAALTATQGDRAKTQEERERRRNDDRARKQELRRNEARNR